jgi:hypothetical protein
MSPTHSNTRAKFFELEKYIKIKMSDSSTAAVGLSTSHSSNSSAVPLTTSGGGVVKIPSLIMREEMKNSGETMAFLQSGLSRVIKETREYVALQLKASDAEAKLAASVVAWAGAAEENDATRATTLKSNSDRCTLPTVEGRKKAVLFANGIFFRFACGVAVGAAVWQHSG